MTAVLSASKNDTAKVALYVADCRAWISTCCRRISIPAVGISPLKTGLTRNRPSVLAWARLRTSARAPVDLILQARSEDGPFRDLTDFAHRVDLRSVGKRSLECLIKVGAMDAFGERQSLLEALDQIISISSSHFKALLSGQMSFFGTVAGIDEGFTLPLALMVDRRAQLEWERELLGLYVSAHPLTPYLPFLKNKITHFSGQLSEASHKEKVIVAGMVIRFRRHQTKTGNAMGFATLEDIQGSIELVLFPKTWDRYGKLIEMDRVLVAEGKVDMQSGDPKLLVDKLKVEDMVDLPPDQANDPALLEWMPPGSSDHAGYTDDLPELDLEPLPPLPSFQFPTRDSAPASPPVEEDPQPPQAFTPAAPAPASAPAPRENEGEEWDDVPPPPPLPDDWYLMEPPSDYRADGPMPSNGPLPVAVSPESAPQIRQEAAPPVSPAQPPAESQSAAPLPF